MIRYLLISLVIAPWVNATPTPSCELTLIRAPGVTLTAMRKKSIARINRINEMVPSVDFRYLETQAAHEQPFDERVPQALREVFSEGVGYVARPAPTSPDPLTAGVATEKNSFSTMVETHFAGRDIRTAAYVSLPAATPKLLSAGGYLIGPEHKVVLVHGHGGGTPTATGKNAMSIGEALVGFGIPTLALDLPGHGLATKNPAGLMSLEDQVDLLLAQMNQLIHPDVKIVFSGHSWGGQYAVYMRSHSYLKKFDRISRYIALSPPVVTTPEFEKDFSANFETYAKGFAKGDVTFMRNILVNGKKSDISGQFLSWSQLDYQTPRLNKEFQARLKPLTVIVGIHDGPVYVGREALFEEAFGNLDGESEFIKLGPSLTFKSIDANDLQLTGHNVFDNIIPETYDAARKSGVRYVYHKIGELVLQVAKPELPAAVRPAIATLEPIVRYFIRDLGFREMLEDLEEYVEYGSSEHKSISERKKVLQDYLNRLNRIEREGNDLAKTTVRDASEKLARMLNLPADLSLRDAMVELNAPALEADRRAELQAYVNEIDKIIQVERSDSQFRAEEARLRLEFASEIEALNLNDLADYLPHFNDLKKKPAGLSDVELKKRDRLRAGLDSLHKQWLKIVDDRDHRASVERSRLMSEIKKPADVVDHRVARRLLSYTHAPERIANLEKYIQELPGVIKLATEQATADTTARLDEIKFPDDEAMPREKAVTKAREEISNQDEILNYNYTGNDPLATSIVKALQKAIYDREEQNTGGKGPDALSLKDLNARVDKLRIDRNKATEAFDKLWEEDEDTPADERLRSPRLIPMFESYARTLEHYTRLDQIFSEREAWFIEQNKRGLLTAELVIRSTPEHLELRRKIYHAEDVFKTARADLEKAKQEEALAGHLIGPSYKVDQANRLAHLLYGEDNLNNQLQANEALLEVRRGKVSKYERKRDELRYRYLKRIKELGKVVGSESRELNMYQLLDQPLAAVLDLIENDQVVARAVTKAKNRWEPIAKELRRLSESKDTDSY